MSDRKVEAALGDGEDLVVTDAMRLAVRREECSIGGHAFSVVSEWGEAGPVKVICTRCDGSWDVIRS